MVEISLYRIPFEMDGENVMAFKRGDDILSRIQLYKTSSFTTDESFSSGQDRIVFGDGPIAITNANYIVVTNTESPKVPFFFWVTRWEIFSNPSNIYDGSLQERSATLVAYITPDYMTQCLFPIQYEIEGFMVQATGKRTVISPDTTGRGTIPRTIDFPRSSNAETFFRRTIDAGESEGFYLVVAFTVEDGAVQTAWVKVKSSTTTELIDEIAKIATATKLQYHNTGGSPYNIKISRIYAIPVKWTQASTFPPFKEGSITWDLAMEGGTTWRAYFVEPSDGRFGSNARIQLFQDDLQSYMDPYSRVYFFTPSRVIELQDPTCQRQIDIVLGVGAEYGSDQISVTMILDGKTYDITDDFLVDFAVNEQALWQEQHGQEVVLNKVAAAVGGIGGAIGGAVSGNYFGAVQSIVGSVSSFMGVDSGLRDPAVQKGQGNFLTTYAQRSHIFAIIVSGHFEYENPPYKEYVKRYGYTLTEPVFVKYEGYNTEDPNTLLYPSEDLGDDLSIGFFLKMSHVRIKRLEMGSSAEAANYIKARLEAGVRFCDPRSIDR